MSRNETALSAHQQVTLRRIALGVVPLGTLPKADVAHLKAVGLIEVGQATATLTPLGRLRYEALPRPKGTAPAAAATDLAAALATAFTRTRT